jgi:OPA family glycerol-3-phosphate transporter-like MFS transporter
LLAIGESEHAIARANDLKPTNNPTLTPESGYNPAPTPLATNSGAASYPRASLQLGCLILGYIGVYLCRKNFSVAVPLLQKSFSATKAQIGAIDSYATVAYMAGKLFWGPNLVDRFGGRICFFIVLLGVALFGGLSAFVNTLPLLGACYVANRFFGAGGWGGMVKLVPDWFPERHMALAMAVLSLSFVFGGVCALLLAGRIAALSGNDWRAVMGFPSLALLLIAGICWLVLSRNTNSPGAGAAPADRWTYRRFLELLTIPQFWMLCCLSFTLTITRETFNVWTVDFLKTEGGSQMSTQMAALLSTPFDAMGAVGILGLGWLLDRITGRQRKWLLFSILTTVAALIFVLPILVRTRLWMVITAVGLIGLLSYGPYSLLAGVLSLEVRGKSFVASVAGMVDAAGYLAGIISGYCFGRILDIGGYKLGFRCLAVATVVGALLCLSLNRPRQHLQNSACAA